MEKRRMKLESERLCLRAWRASDLDPFARMCADPRVMRYFPACLERAQVAAMIRRIRAHFACHGYGLWAVEVKGEASFIGFVGLAQPGFDAAFMPAVEVGWRLDRAYWGKGYATEAAGCALSAGFEHWGLREIVAMTTTANRPSRRVMQRLGMTRDPADDFDHPMIDTGHALRRHVLYRLPAEAWRRRRSSPASGGALSSR
jgi:ribosomal-protein-alanine N-acetyltransferase